MDQELVQYLDTRFQSLEQRIDHRFGQVDQRFEGIDQRFDQIDQRFGQVDRRFEGIDHRFEQIDRRFEGIDRQFAEMRQEMNERSGEVKRHFGILTEGLRHELHIVAEGLAMHIQVQHVQERAYFDRKFEDTHALIRSSYDHLQQQHNQIQQRVENLERKDQN